jgi:predicted nucleotidyltransferase
MSCAASTTLSRALNKLSDETYRLIAGDSVGERHRDLLARQPYPLAFVTVSGSHLYGFSSPDSDWDLRGVHIVPAARVLSLDGYEDTLEDETFVGGIPAIERTGTDSRGTRYTNVLDELVTHDARKYFRLLLKNNGYVLEQIFSPLVVSDGGGRLERLREIARGCITSRHGLHYKGFGYGEWTKFVDNPTKTVKRILYVFRVLLSGIHLMRTGEVEANILRVNETIGPPYIDDLIAQKRAGAETGQLAAGHGLDYYTREYERLMAMLIEAAEASTLPKEPSAAARAELNALLLEMRLSA